MKGSQVLPVRKLKFLDVSSAEVAGYRGLFAHITAPTQSLAGASLGIFHTGGEGAAAWDFCCSY